MTRSSVSIVAAVLLLSGCAASQIKTHDGPEKPLDEIALIKCGENILVNGVDGNKAHKVAAGGGLWYRDCEISVTPGRHTFDVCYDASYSTGTLNVTNRCARDIRLPLDAQAGRIYRIKYEAKAGKWRTWIEDVTAAERTKIEEERRKKVAEKK